MLWVGGVGGGVYNGRTTPKIRLLGLILHKIAHVDVLGALCILITSVCQKYNTLYYGHIIGVCGRVVDYHLVLTINYYG